MMVDVGKNARISDGGEVEYGERLCLMSRKYLEFA